MKPPTKSKDVDKEWLEYVLTNFESRQTPESKVAIETWNLSDATGIEDSFQGDIHNLEVKATVHKNEKSTEKEYNLNIKFTTQDTTQKEFNKLFKDPNREFLLHSKLMTILNNYQAKRTKNRFPIYTPTYVYGEVKDDILILVTENMKDQGYNNKSKSDLLNLNEAKSVVIQLARLHAISYVYNGRHKLIEEEEYSMFTVEKTLDLFTSSQDHFIDIAVELLEHYKTIKPKKLNDSQEATEIKTNTETEISKDDQEINEASIDKDLIMKIQLAKPQITEKNKNAFGERNKKQKILCLNHGDPWNDNILLKYKSEDNISVCLTDWESVHWNTPAYDLNYFLAGALTPELRLGHMDELLKHYHDHFTEILKALKSKKTWCYKHFKDEFDAVSVWGFLKSLRFTMTLSKEAKDIKMLNKNSTSLELIMKGFSKAMLGILNLHSFVMDKFTIKFMRAYTSPVLEEMKTNKYPELNKRFLANIKEGDKRGFFELEEGNDAENVSPKDGHVNDIAIDDKKSNDDNARDDNILKSTNNDRNKSIDN